MFCQKRLFRKLVAYFKNFDSHCANIKQVAIRQHKKVFNIKSCPDTHITDTRGNGNATNDCGRSDKRARI